MNVFIRPSATIKWPPPRLPLYACLAAEANAAPALAGFSAGRLGLLLLQLQFICAMIVFPCLGPGIITQAHAAEPVQIVVEGIAGDARKNVLEAVALPYGLVREGKVDRLWLERFINQLDQKILTALEPFGYYNARVDLQLETEKPEEYRLKIMVTPGEPTRVIELKVSLSGPGASAETMQELVAAFPLQQGDVLLHHKYEQAKQNLLTQAQNLGYLDAAFAVHEIQVNQAAAGAIINLLLETGERYFFNSITIEGAADYLDSFIRRYLTFRPGEVFSYNKLAESQLQFNNSERFREVMFVAEKNEAQEFKIPVHVKVKPVPRRSLRPGIGYGTDTGARFSLRYRDLNMLHEGHEFNSNLYIAEHLQGLATSYIIPSAENIRNFTSAQFNVQWEDISTYRSQLVSAELARSGSLGKQRQGTAYLRFQEESYTIADQDTNSRYVLPGFRFSDNYYDNMIRPSRGFRYAFDLRGTHRSLGSTNELLQLLTEASHILPLPWRLSLQTKAKANVTIFSDPLTDLPPSLRFFAGGDQSVRGYSYQSLGPRDAQGRVIGGKHLLTGVVELQRALFTDWAVSTFYNAGNAFDSFVDLTLYQAAGIGLHYYTPVGALNLSVARQIGVESPGYRIHFTVGFEL